MSYFDHIKTNEDFEEHAAVNVPIYAKREKRSAWLGLVSFIAGVFFIFRGDLAIGVTLLVLALHWDLQTMTNHLLLTMTTYHRATAHVGRSSN